MQLLLDTCAFVWLVSAPDRLSPRVAEAVDTTDAQLSLSDASVWEICLKWQTGKLRLPDPPRSWVEKQCKLWELTPAPIERTDLYRVSELPEHHRDPFDRLIVAQAIERGFTIATPDAYIHRYPVSALW